MNKIAANVFMFLAFLVCMGLVIWGQRTVGYVYLAAQLVGVAGLISLLYVYNKKHR